LGLGITALSVSTDVNQLYGGGYRPDFPTDIDKPAKWLHDDQLLQWVKNYDVMLMVGYAATEKKYGYPDLDKYGTLDFDRIFPNVEESDVNRLRMDAKDIYSEIDGDTSILQTKYEQNAIQTARQFVQNRVHANAIEEIAYFLNLFHDLTPDKVREIIAKHLD